MPHLPAPALTLSGLHPLVFAHRGSSATLPEHTLEAYLRAIDEGADGLECDVRLTRDGHLVCIHDRRLDRTSDGRGRSARPPWMSSPAGLRLLARQPDGANRAGVLTLDRLVTAALEAGRPLRLLIETKHPTRFRGAVEQRLVDLLRRYGLAGSDGSVRITVMSFSPFAVRRMRALAPHVPTVFLFELLTPGIRDGRAPFGAQTLGPSVAALRARPELVSRAHERGNRVYVWTVNTPDQVDLRCGRVWTASSPTVRPTWCPGYAPDLGHAPDGVTPAREGADSATCPSTTGASSTV